MWDEIEEYIEWLGLWFLRFGVENTAAHLPVTTAPERERERERESMCVFIKKKKKEKAFCTFELKDSLKLQCGGLV